MLVSIDDARRMPFVDPERLVLIGSSHGGWAIMELLAFEAAGRLPFNLAALRGAPAGARAGRGSSAASSSIPIAARRTGRAAAAGAFRRRCCSC